MTHFDVFNGDADGLCALQQLRLAAPRSTVLVTGVKRDIALLQRVPAGPGDSVTALDIALDVNRAALTALLARGVTVEYFDHHHPGDVPVHAGLAAHIDCAPDVCTGILVDRHLGGAQRVWAVVAAFGDNLVGPARRLAASLGLDEERQAVLRELGENLAYNAYGDSEADLIVHPAELFGIMRGHADPFRFAGSAAVLRRIDESRRADLESARTSAPALRSPGAAMYILPDAAWSRRVRGAFGNELALAHPARAHAVLTPDGQQGYTVSVRAPIARPMGADALCREFATGGGREAAAGINHLPADRLGAFRRRFERAFP
jgi:hypothetical protein